MGIAISGIDHIAMTATDFEESLAFYRKVLGAETPHEQLYRNGRIGSQPMVIGGAVINLQPADNPAYIVAATPTPGSVDLCFRWDDAIDTAITHLRACGVEVIEGPVPRPAADGQWGQSVYFRDPDGNLLELLSTVV